MSEPEGGEEEDRDESTSKRPESKRGSPLQRRCSRCHRRRGGGSPEEGEDEDAMRERRRLFRRALSSLLGSIEAAAAARACRVPVLTFGFYDYFLRFIGGIFDAKGADAILSFEKFCCNLPRPLLQVLEGRLWELGRVLLYVDEKKIATCFSNDYYGFVVVISVILSLETKYQQDQASDVGVLLADTDGIFHSIKSRSEQEREPDASTNKTSSEGSKYTVTDNIEDDNKD
ncbi:hypothetical protein AHAS_Ahas11G0144900 [Arachis hypogaea]